MAQTQHDPDDNEGVVAVLILNALPALPVDMTSHRAGWHCEDQRYGARSLKIGVASIHFGPSTIRTISSANSAQVRVIGMVEDTSNE